MGEPIKQKENDNDISLGDVIVCIGLIALVLVSIFFTLGFASVIDCWQPQPTSDLITTNVSIPTSFEINNYISFYPGGTTLVVDSNNRGYYYTQWFQKLMRPGHSYEIQYWCDKNGDRRIYKYRDLAEPPVDITKCVTINGVCK